MQHSQNVMPLAIGHLSASTKPHQLGKDRVLGASHGELDVFEACDGGGCVAAPRKFGPCEPIRSDREDVELERALQMDHIECATTLCRKLDCAGIDIENIVQPGA